LVSERRIRAAYELATGTLDGYTVASRRSSAPSALEDLGSLSATGVGVVGLLGGGGVDIGDDVMDLSRSAEMDYFNTKMAAHCKDSVRASDFAFAAIDGLPKNVIATLLNELSKGKEFALSFATTEGTRAGKERAVRYWRVFCALLRIPEVVSSFSNSYYLHYFAAYMGLVWRKYGGDQFGLAGATVEQMISQVVKWLELRFGVSVRSFDKVLSEVCKGLKRRSGAGLGVMMLPVETYVFIQKTLLGRGDPLSLCLADSQKMRFLGLRRISETSSTNRHDGGAGRDARLLLHDNCYHNAVEFAPYWPKTKNGVNLLRPFPLDDELGVFGCTSCFIARFKANEQFLLEHPEVDRKKLPFFHVNGAPLHRDDVEACLSELCALAFKEEPNVPHLNPELYRINTHSERKGGSCFYLAHCDRGEAFVRWLGDWKSLSFFVYARVTQKYRLAMSSKASGVLSAMFK